MKLAFVLFRYFPFGGLQRDMLAIASECAMRGHEIDIYCRSWDGNVPSFEKINIKQLPNKKLTNTAKNNQFQADLKSELKHLNYDAVIGFNKIPGVDIYYAADTCFKAKLYRERPWFYRFLPRYVHHVKEEAALFDKNSGTHILAISQSAIEEYKAFYQLDPQRITLLPPGINRRFINQTAERLNLLHQELGLPQDQKIILMVGSGFKTKGLDRAIRAISGLPQSIKASAHLVVAGSDRPDAFIQQARDAGLASQIHFLGGRNDVEKLLRSADILIHPAYREAAGIVLLESAVSALPVLVTDVCGYAHYISEHNLGIVLSSPFKQAALDEALKKALTDTQVVSQWRENCVSFAKNANVYDMPKIAADKIELYANGKNARG